MTSGPIDDIIIGQSAPAKELKKLIEVVVEAPTSVLVLGETGTGKELVARAIHVASGRLTGWYQSIVRRSHQSCWSPRFSAMRKAPSPAPTSPAMGRRRTGPRRYPVPRRDWRHAFAPPDEAAAGAGGTDRPELAAMMRSKRLISDLSAPPTRISKHVLMTALSAPISITGSMFFRSRCQALPRGRLISR